MDFGMDRIVIMGAGRFGSSIAESLAASKCMLTIIDHDPECITKLRDRNIDARFLVGDVTTPSLLRKAGCEDADAILALTNHDITNLAACHICHTTFDHESTVRIAKLRNKELVDNRRLLNSFGVSWGYNVEDMITDEFVKILSFLGVRSVHSYWNDKINIFTTSVSAGDGLAGITVGELERAGRRGSFKVVAIMRDKVPTACTPETELREQDELVVVSQRHAGIDALNKRRGETGTESRKIFIAGGTLIGRTIAKQIEERYNVTLIEPSQAVCAEIIQDLNHTVVDHGNPADANILRNENIEDSYYFCAVTHNDEENILAAMLAKNMGCRKVAVLVRKNSYGDVLQHHRIDTVLSPANVTIGTLLKELRGRKHESVQLLNDAGAQLLEFSIHEQAKIVGSSFDRIEWPANVIPCVLGSAPAKEGGKMHLLFPDSGHVIKGGDRIIVCMTDGDSHTLNALLDIPFYA